MFSLNRRCRSGSFPRTLALSSRAPSTARPRRHRRRYPGHPQAAQLRSAARRARRVRSLQHRHRAGLRGRRSQRTLAASAAIGLGIWTSVPLVTTRRYQHAPDRRQGARAQWTSNADQVLGRLSVNANVFPVTSTVSLSAPYTASGGFTIGTVDATSGFSATWGFAWGDAHQNALDAARWFDTNLIYQGMPRQ